MPQTLPQATNDPHLLWRFPDTHRQVSCGVTVPFSWVLVNKVLLCLQGFTSQSYVSSGSSIVGLMATSSRRTCSIPTLRAPVMWQTTTDPYLHSRYSNTGLSQSLWGPWVLVHTTFVWALWASLAGMGFDSKPEFAPPTVLLGLPLCPWSWGYLHMAGLVKHSHRSWPWTWGISSQPLVSPAPAR